MSARGYIDVVHNDGRRWLWDLKEFWTLEEAVKRATKLNKKATELGVDWRYEATEKPAKSFREQFHRDGSPRPGACADCDGAPCSCTYP